MGKKFAPNYANLFLAEWEEEALEKCVLKPSVYWRFLDDIFMIWEHSKEDFYKFVKILNTHHPSITVKAELSSESMHFLDTVVYKGNRFKETGTFDTKVYFKPTDTLELLHKKSHHPNHTFKGLIKSQILRYVKICNNIQDVMIACRKLFAALVRRGYSERFLRNIKDKTLCELRKTPNKGSSQRCTTRNCKLCSTQIVVVSGKTMGGVLYAGNQIQIPTTQNCDSTNGIYCIVCSKCKKLETGLYFRKRINIHRSYVWLKKDTAVATHFNSGSCRATHLRVPR